MVKGSHLKYKHECKNKNRGTELKRCEPFTRRHTTFKLDDSAGKQLKRKRNSVPFKCLYSPSDLDDTCHHVILSHIGQVLVVQPLVGRL